MTDGYQLSTQGRVTIGKILRNCAEDLLAASVCHPAAVKAETRAKAFKLLEPVGNSVSNG